MRNYVLILVMPVVNSVNAYISIQYCLWNWFNSFYLMRVLLQHYPHWIVWSYFLPSTSLHGPPPYFFYLALFQLICFGYIFLYFTSLHILYLVSCRPPTQPISLQGCKIPKFCFYLQNHVLILVVNSSLLLKLVYSFCLLHVFISISLKSV